MDKNYLPLIPKPRDAKISDGVLSLILEGKSAFTLKISANDSPVFAFAVQKMQTQLQEKLHTADFNGEKIISLSVSSEVKPACCDAYTLKVTEDGCEIIGFDAGGLLYGVVTFLKLLKSDENLGWVVPCCEIVDYPAYPDRGYFLETRWGSEFLTKEEYFEIIDYCVDLKINQLTVGLYGCWNLQYDYRIAEYLYVPLKNHPELKTPMPIKYYSPKQGGYVHKENVLPTMFTEDFFGEVCAYAKERNIKIKPLFNSLGHNTLIPRLHPEISAKDEDGTPRNYGFCLTDEKTYEFMFSIYDEIIDKYLTPNGLDGFQIGLDEVRSEAAVDINDPFKIVDPQCSCSECRKHEYADLFCEYIIRLAKHLKEKGMKHVYVYNDMLMRHLDVLHEEFRDRLEKEGLLDVIVIDHWTYDNNPERFFGGNNNASRVNNLFRGIVKPFNGYYQWMISRAFLDNIRHLTKICKKVGLEGVESYSLFEYSFDQNQAYQAEVAWNDDDLECENYDDFFARYAGRVCPNRPEEAKRVFESMYRLMYNGGGVYDTCYYYYSYCRPNLPYPRNFPAEMFKKLVVDEKLARIDTLKNTQKVASHAAAFFRYDLEQEGENRLNGAWALIARQYAVHADEMATLLLLHQKYAEGNVSADELLAQVSRLKNNRLDLLRFAEEVRMNATLYTYQREMSVFYQILVDLENYLTDCIKNNIPHKFDLTDFSGISSKDMDFLR